MDLTQGTPDGAALSTINGDWVLAHDAATGRFTRRFTFALPTAGLADGIRWQPNTGFTLSFPTFDYNARAAGAPEGVTLTNGGDGVRLTFPVPRTVRRVKISGALSADVIEARRVDGDVITEDAFADAGHGSAGAILNAADRQLVVRQKRAGVSVALPVGNVEEILVRSAAANIRVGVAIPALGDEVFYLGPDAGAVLTNPATAANIGPPLATLLQGASDRLTDSLAGEALPSSMAMTLVIESDTPSRAHITGFVLRYRLFRRRFDDLSPKRVLEFAGDSLTTRQVTIDVPRGAALWSATLRMMGPFSEQGGEEEDDGGADSGEPPPAPQTEASDLGVQLRPRESAAARVTLAQAALVQGATLDLVALSETSEGRLRLHEDAQGKPGAATAEASFAPVPAGTRRVVRVNFDPASVVSAGPVWVSVQCDSGGFVWLTNVPGGDAGSQMLRRAAGDVVWTAVSAASDRGASIAFVTASGGDDANPMAGPSAFHGVRLHLAGVRLRGLVPPPGSPGDKETRFSIAAAIQPVVSSGVAGTLVPVSLSLVSSERGRVTVYPPEFEFDP